MLGVEDREDDPDEGPLDVSGGVDIEAIEDIVLKLYVCTVVYCCGSTYKSSKDERKRYHSLFLLMDTMIRRLCLLEAGALHS